MCGESNRRWNEVIAAKCTVTQLSFTKRPISCPHSRSTVVLPFGSWPCNDHASPLRSDSFRGYRRLIGHRTMDPLFLSGAIPPRKIFTNSPLSLWQRVPRGTCLFFSLASYLSLLSVLDRSSTRTKHDIEIEKERERERERIAKVKLEK